ncbi:hypothetical protein MHYP_G00174160 [Metynnis hypsauchen]
MQTPTQDFYAEDFGSFTIVTTTTTTTQTPRTALATTTTVDETDVTEDYAMMDNTVLTQRVIIGTMALLFSFFLIIFVVYISRKCCPPHSTKNPALLSHSEPATDEDPAEAANGGPGHTGAL